MKTQPENIPFSQRNFFEIVLKRKWLILIMFTVISATCMIGTLQMKPVYETTAKISLEKDVDQEKQVLLDLPGMRHDLFDYVASEIEVIKSWPIIEKVVNKLELNKLFQSELKASVPNNSRLSGAVPRQNRSIIPDDESFQLAMNYLMGSVDVQKIKNTNVITITYQSEDAGLAQQVVNEIVMTYKEHRNSSADDWDTDDRLDKQIAKYKAKLNRLAARSANLKKKWKMHSTELKADILQQNLVKHQELATEVRTRYDARQARLRIVEQQLAQKKAVAIPSMNTDVTASLDNHIAKLKEQLLALDIQIKELLQTYTPKEKNVATLLEKKRFLQKSYNQAIEQFIAQERVEINVLGDQIKKLDADCSYILNEVAALSQPEKELNKIDDDLENTRDIHSMLVKEREVNNIAKSKKDKMIKVNIISPAFRPIKPIKPNKRVNFLLAIILGLIIGTGTAFGVEYLNDSRNQIQAAKAKEQFSGSIRENRHYAARSNADYSGRKDPDFDYTAPKKRKRQNRLVTSLAFIFSALLISALVILLVKSDLMGQPKGNGKHTESKQQQPARLNNLVEASEHEKSTIVKTGDTIFKIMLREYGFINEPLLAVVKKMNPTISNRKFPEAGATLYLPPSKTLYPDYVNRFAVHVCSYRGFQYASRDYNSLNQRNYEVSVVSINLPNRGRFYRIAVGSFDTRSEAEYYRRMLISRNQFNWASVLDFDKT